MAQRSVPVALQTLGNLSNLPNESTPHGENHICLDASGVPGNHGAHGGHGIAGHSGQDGQNGYNGNSALGMSVAMRVREENVEVTCVTYGTVQEELTYHLSLGDSNTSIFMQAQGGNGGSGGSGGDGADGLPGKNGRSATEYSAAENGGRGMDGGDGGNGGHGGHAGHGANIDIGISQFDTDLLLLLKTKPIVLAGTPGGGGLGGKAGMGGPGGRGGSGYHWMERRGDYTYARSRPGAYDGPPGRDGNPGVVGSLGRLGKDGNFRIHVEGEHTYPGRYDLLICDDVLVSDKHSYEIIEPGSRCSVHYSVFNCGLMPTPAHQDVVMSLKLTEMINPIQIPDETGQGSVVLPRSIDPRDGKIVLPKSIHFTITDILVPTIGSPLHFWTKLLHSATLGRINQNFPLVDDQATVIAVQNALKMSFVIGNVAIEQASEGIVSCEVENISNNPIGIQAFPSRKASVSINVRDQEEELIEDVHGNTIRSVEIAMGYRFNESSLPASMVRLGNLVGEESSEFETITGKRIKEIENIPPGGRMKYYCFVSVAPDETNNLKLEHATIGVCMKLHVGHPIMTHSLQDMQWRPFQIQIASPYQPIIGEAKCLLVVNNRTRQDELFFWRSFCSSSLQCDENDISIWNISLYNGFSFKYMVSRHNNIERDETILESIGSTFGKWKAPIVVLNNSCTIFDTMVDDSEDLPLTNLYHDEFLEACKDHGCRVYVCGARKGIEYPKYLLLIPVNDAKQKYFSSYQSFEENGPKTIWSSHSLFLDTPNELEKVVIDNSDSASNPSDLSGLLEKKKNKKKGFVQRFFVLRKEEGYLAYYDKANATAPTRTYQLKECSIIPNENEIRLKIPSENGRNPFLVLKHGSTTSGNLKIWKRAISEAIDYSKNPDEHNAVEKSNALLLEGLGLDSKRPNGPDYFCTFPILRKGDTSENALKREAEKIYLRMVTLYPELSVLVVYEYVKRENQVRKKGMGVTDKTIGNVSIYGGVDYREGNVFMDVSENGNNEKDGDHLVHADFTSVKNMYGYLKALPFNRKLDILKYYSEEVCSFSYGNAVQNIDIDLIGDAILSDIADEISIFCKGKETAGEKLKLLGKGDVLIEKWGQRMKSLNSLSKKENIGIIQMDSKKHYEMFKILTSLKFILSSIVPLQGKMMKMGREGQIFKTARSLIVELENVVLMELKLKKASELKNSLGESLDKVMKNYRKNGLIHAGKSVQKTSVLKHFRFLHGIGKCEQFIEKEKSSIPVISQKEFDYMKTNMRKTNLPKIRFPNGRDNSDSERSVAISRFSANHAPSKEPSYPMEIINSPSSYEGQQH